MRGGLRLLLLPLIAAPALCGCLAIPVAVAGASEGINYTYMSVAYRSMTYPIWPSYAATLAALKKMRIDKLESGKTEEGFRISAKTKKLKITISLSSVTPKVTQISVNAKKNFFMKDRTLAVEIITQTVLILENQELARTSAPK